MIVAIHLMDVPFRKRRVGELENRLLRNARLDLTNKVVVAAEIGGHLVIRGNKGLIGLVPNADEQDYKNSRDKQPLKPCLLKIGFTNAIQDQEDGKNTEEGNKNAKSVIAPNPGYHEQSKQET